MYIAVIPQHLPTLIQALAPTVNNYGYMAVGGLVIVEDFGVPVPGETILITAAVFAGAGQLNIFLVLLVGFLAAVIGDSIGFAIGNFGGRPLINRFGKYIFLTSQRMDKAEKFFARNGGKVIIMARFIDGLRQLNGIIAGISEMRWPTFMTYNAIGAGLWTGLWCSVGYFGGSHISAFHKYEIDLTILVAILLISYIGFRLVKHKFAVNVYRSGK